MNDRETIRVTFTCSHCSSTNELTAADVHEATVIHCSHCGASIAPLGLLNKKPALERHAELART
jgi:peptide subunit release factor 1 (eRF1)